VGSTVELWGQNLLVNRVAERADTIAYALLTGVQRVPRHYRD
jgi:alanine racemase